MRKLTFCLAIAALLFGANPARSGELKLDIFVSEPDEINVTSALIMGPTEMMVVSAQATKSSASRLADTIKQKGLKLKYIYLTHPHLDHSQGAGILLKSFPEARFIATPEVAFLQRRRIQSDDKLAESRYGDNAAIPSVPAEDYADSRIYIDENLIEIWKDIIGDAGFGHPDEPHSALHIPSLRALIPSDVVYYDAHVMMGGSTKESRAVWLKQLNAWIEQDFDIVVPGHMPKGAPLTAIGALTHTRDYILAYDKAISGSSTSDEVIEKMLALYPEMPHRSALYLGTYLNFKEMHRLTFNPTIEKVASFLPESLVKWIDERIFESRKQDYNPTP